VKAPSTAIVNGVTQTGASGLVVGARLVIKPDPL
jgi:hypothetical protein